MLVGAFYFAGQLIIFSLGRASSWDEAVYLSQVSPGITALPFVASRARGITVLIWPVLEFGGSLPAVRLFLAAGSALALVAVYRPWVSVIGFGAAIAAAAFGSTWVALLYGSEVMPNLWAALLAVGTIGVFSRMLMGNGSTRDLVLTTVLLALLGLFRPPDALPVFVAIAAVGLWTKAMTTGRIVLLLGGLIAGWIPWSVEMSVRSAESSNRCGGRGTWLTLARPHLELASFSIWQC